MSEKKKPDFLQYPENSRVMRTHETMVDLISGRATQSTLIDAMHFGLLGSEFVSPFMSAYVNEYLDEDDEDCYYQGGKWKDPKPNRILSRNIFGHGALAPHPNIKQLTSEEAEQHARELIEEEERQKSKAEKKKKKKMRQKERKRYEKENAIQDKHLAIQDKNVPDKEPEMSISSENQGGSHNVLSIREVNQSHDPGPGGTPSQSHDPEKRSVCSEDENEVDEFNDDKVSTETEELDMGSSFVSTVASIAKKRLDQKPKLEKKKISAQLQPSVDQNKFLQAEDKNYNSAKQPPEKNHNSSGQQPVEKTHSEMQEDSEDLVKKSTELAIIGNQYAAHGHLEVAVTFFTDAIKFNPREYKLFGNRSFCYEKLGQYEKALVDADLALVMEPNWIKGLFRKGKALTGLKRYCEAALIYAEVLRLDGSCQDAARELSRVQFFQLMEMGFTWKQSDEALRTHATFEEALDALSGTEVGHSGVDKAQEPLAEEWETVVVPKRELGAASQTQSTSNSPTPLKTNGFKQQLFPVWVGSVMPGVTEPGLHSLFSRAGAVHSIKTLPDQQCAFIHYTSKEDCERAIQLLNGRVVGGVCLSVRHPTNIHTNLGVSSSAVTEPPMRDHLASKKRSVGKQKQECYFWRTTGCVKRERCTFLHLPESKGIELDKLPVRMMER